MVGPIVSDRMSVLFLEVESVYESLNLPPPYARPICMQVGTAHVALYIILHNGVGTTNISSIVH